MKTIPVEFPQFNTVLHITVPPGCETQAFANSLAVKYYEDGATHIILTPLLETIQITVHFP